MPYRYIDQSMNPTPVNQQVNYGPRADIGAPRLAELQQHFGTPNVLERITQYNTRHATYVAAAQAGNRPLTIQEEAARRTRGQAANASINHVIASGTGQNIFNEGTLMFRDGAARTTANMAAALGPNHPGQQQARLNVLRGLAEQAATVGRQQGYSRAIIEERGGERLTNNPANRRIYGNAQDGQTLRTGETRDKALQHTLTAFQGATPATRFRAYKDVLRMTFDSPGNLRVGDNYGNNLASTGFDMPLTAAQTPTARGKRLLDAHKVFAPPRLLTPDRLFTRDLASNAKVSSSVEFTPMAPSKKRARAELSPLPQKKLNKASFQSSPGFRKIPGK